MSAYTDQLRSYMDSGMSYEEASTKASNGNTLPVEDTNKPTQPEPLFQYHGGTHTVDKSGTSQPNTGGGYSAGFDNSKRDPNNYNQSGGFRDRASRNRERHNAIARHEFAGVPVDLSSLDNNLLGL